MADSTGSPRGALAEGDRAAIPLRPAAPRAEQIPLFPASWFRFAGSREIGHAPLAREMLERRLIAFRDEQGTPLVMEGRCPHQGADLGKAAIRDGLLICPFHGWGFATGGQCLHIPNGQEIPGFARLQVYPTAEQHGSVFFFNGPRPLFPMPFLDGSAPGQYQAAAPLVMEYDAPWYMVMGNVFDLQHFQVVHDRRLLEAPVIDEPAPFARRMRYRVAVVGDSFADGFLRRFLGPTVAVEHVMWAGNIIVTRAQFQKQGQSEMLFVAKATGPSRCVMEVMVLRRRQAGWLLGGPARRAASLWLRRKLTAAFLEHESEGLGSIRYQPGSFVESDREVVEYLNWLAALPRQ